MHDWRKDLEEFMIKHDEYMETSTTALLSISQLKTCLEEFEKQGINVELPRESFSRLVSWFFEDAKKHKDNYEQKLKQYKNIDGGDNGSNLVD